MSERMDCRDLTRRYGGQSLADRRAQRCAQFLAAGLEVFGTTGFRAASVRQVCRQAALTDRYFYESFDCMEDLLLAVYHQQFDRLGQQLQDLMADQDAVKAPQETVRSALDALLTFVSDPRVARVCWLEVLGINARVDAIYNAVLQGYADTLVAMMQALHPCWRPKSAEAKIIGIAAVGALSETVKYWVLSGYQESRSELLEVTLAVYLRLFGVDAFPAR